MKRLLLGALAAAALFLWPHDRARAYVCAVPNIFKAAHNADANQVNANFSALVQCLNFLDATNVTGPIYASNFLPASVAQATFGGTQSYTLPASIKLLGLAAGCAQIDATGKLTSAGAPCAPGGLQTVANGGTGVAGGWITGRCFYYSGSVFAQRGCGPFTIAVSAPVLVNSTPPPTPVPTPTPTPGPPTVTAMVERQTTIMRVQNCPQVQPLTGGGCDPDLWPRFIWSSTIAYRFYSSSDGGFTWTFVRSDSTSGSDTELPVITPDCASESAGVTYAYCPSGTWTPTAPPGLTGLNFSAPTNAPGQTPAPPTPTPAPPPTPVPTPTPTPLPSWLAQLSLTLPLPMAYGGTGVTGTAWAPSAPPFGDALGANGTTGQVTWLPSLPALDNNGAGCQAGAHPGTPYCAGIAPALYTWTGIPIALAGGSCAAIITATDPPCATTTLAVPGYPVAGLAARLAPYLPAPGGGLHALQVSDAATHIYRLNETTGVTAIDTGSVPLNGSWTPAPGPGFCAQGATPLTSDQVAAASCPNANSSGIETGFLEPVPASSGATAFSVEAVVEPLSDTAASNPEATIVANGKPTFGGFMLQARPAAATGQTGFTVRSIDGNTYGTGTPAFSNGVVYHVVGVLNGTTLSLYVNGALSRTAAFAGSYFRTDYPKTYIGVSPFTATTDHACGCIIEAVAIYTYALSAAQVSAHYAAVSSSVSGIPRYATCAVDEQDGQFPMYYQAQWLNPPGIVTLSVWNSTQHAMPGAYSATVGVACYGAWVNGF